MDAFGAAYVPWEGVNSKEKIFYLKNKFFAGECEFSNVIIWLSAHVSVDTLLKSCFPKQIFNLRTLIDQVTEDSRPKYEEHEKELADMVKQYKVNMLAPWEWADDVADRMDEADWSDEVSKNHSRS